MWLRPKLTDNDKVVTNHKGVLSDIEKYYKDLFTNKNKNTNTTCRSFLETIETPRLTQEDQTALSEYITIDELHNTLLQMADKKSPGNDGLTCEFYKHFWDKIKQPYYDSILHAEANGELSASQRQAIIRLIEKKRRRQN